MPHKKITQDFVSRQGRYELGKSIIGVGGYNQGTEFYFIFSDNKTCGTETTTALSNFSEVRLAVDVSYIRRVKI